MPVISGGGSVTPSGAAGGDLGGNYPNPTVVGATHITAATIALAKLADPTTGKVVGSASNAAAAVYPPGFEIGYDQITSNVTVASSTEASGTTVISCAAHVFDGSPVLAEFFSPIVVPGTRDQIIVSLFEASTQIARICDTQSGNVAGTGVTNVGFAMYGALRFTPTAGSHTYTVTAIQAGANGTIFAGSGGTAGFAPAFVRFTKV